MTRRYPVRSWKKQSWGQGYPSRNVSSTDPFIAHPCDLVDLLGNRSHATFTTIGPMPTRNPYEFRAGLSEIFQKIEHQISNSFVTSRLHWPHKYWNPCLSLCVSWATSRLDAVPQYSIAGFILRGPQRRMQKQSRCAKQAGQVLITPPIRLLLRESQPKISCLPASVSRAQYRGR
jgi:hypothetical protein